MRLKTTLLVNLLLAAGLLLSACQTPTPLPTATTPAATATLQPSPTPTPLPRTFTICLGQEPASLYLYASSTRSTWSVLEAVYDGPIDTRQYTPQPVILEKLPALADGDASYAPVDVAFGDDVVDVDGNLVPLVAGVRVLPSGCGDSSCAVAWDGTSLLQMDALTLRYRLLPGLTWSDGAPLTAADSVYSWQVSADDATPVTRTLLERTASYTALDEQTVAWISVPGYISQDFAEAFWVPLPQHAWGKYTPAELLAAEEVNRKPLGWGAFYIEEWVAGDHITLRRNPHYFRAAEGLPNFDVLVYRFLGDTGDANLAALEIGECDLVDSTVNLTGDLLSALQLEQQGVIRTYNGLGPEWEHLDFGIQPASYDDGYAPFYGDRADFFSDVRVRQAFELCLDRQGLIKNQLFSYTLVPVGYYPPGHPRHVGGEATAFDPAAGSALLDQAGWKDYDNNPATPRTAAGVKGVTDGTPLAVTYYTTTATLSQAAGLHFSLSLAQCGIQATVQPLTAGQLYAAGPEGPLFGRKFDLAQFAWQSSAVSPCFLYTTEQIPTAENRWLGTNVTGFSSAEYDAACQSARQPAPGVDPVAADREAQMLFDELLPVVPLYYRLKVAASRPDLCGYTLDVSARSSLWNLEAMDYAEGCP